jgi:choline dehydrogenase
MYDYIVVGAGSAGCVLAEGLSTRHRVLLLEAGGPDKGPEVAIPAAFSKLFGSEKDWDLYSEPDATAHDRRLYLPRGKMVGGSGSMNAMIYIRGRPSDYDQWETQGATGWGWDTVFPVFRAMESNSRGASQHHGDSGPIRVEDLRSPNPFSRRFVASAVEVGIPANDDFNGDRQAGAGFYQVTQRRGRRWSAADAFLKPALARPTLDLITGATVIRIVIEGSRATGVEFLLNGTAEIVRCDGEVVLAAGSFGSPHLLQLSGIGDPSHLAGIAIQPIISLPEVGQNLQDHAVVGVIQRSTRPGTLDDAENLWELARWALFRRGRLTSNVAEAGAFVNSSHGSEEPDLQFHFGPVYFEDHGRADFTGHAYSLGPMHLNPRSRGTVMAASSDPRRPPAIEGNYLAETSDVEVLVRGVKLAREVLAASPFDEVRGGELLPGPRMTNREQLINFVRSRV